MHHILDTLLIVAVIGFVLAVVLRFVEMERTLKSFLTAAVIIITFLWALCHLGVICVGRL